MELKIFTVMALVLTLSTQANAANKVLAGESLQCGGLLTLEKTPESLVILNVVIEEKNTCQNPLNLAVPSQDIGGVIGQGSVTIEMNPQAIGDVLPIKIGNQTILIKLSESAQREVATATTQEGLKATAKRNEELERREANKNAAAATAVGVTTLLVGGGIAAEAAASNEK